MIAQWQIEQFHQQGFLVVEGVLSPDDIAALQQDFDGWVEESRRHSEVWGETLDGRPRFDLESDHAPITLRCAGSVRRRRFPPPSPPR
jgi:ferric-dicitrate binding protein FerR (iron transport regulator)